MTLHPDVPTRSRGGVPIAAALTSVAAGARICFAAGPGWFRDRTFFKPVVLLTMALCAAVARFAIRALRGRLDEPFQVAVLLAVATIAGVTAFNGLMLIQESAMAPFELADALIISAIVTAPGAFCVWLGARWCVTYRRGGWLGMVGVMLAIAGVILLIAGQGLLNIGGSFP